MWVYKVTWSIEAPATSIGRASETLRLRDWSVAIVFALHRNATSMVETGCALFFGDRGFNVRVECKGI